MLLCSFIYSKIHYTEAFLFNIYEVIFCYLHSHTLQIYIRIYTYIHIYTYTVIHYLPQGEAHFWGILLLICLAVTIKCINAVIFKTVDEMVLTLTLQKLWVIICSCRLYTFCLTQQGFHLVLACGYV